VNVLAIGAHFDDIELGCGGSLAQLAKNGANIFVYVPTVSSFADHRNRERRDADNALAEAQHAAHILGIKELICGHFKTFEVEFAEALNVEILKILEEKHIDTLFTHWVGDNHHDHQAVSKASIHCSRHIPRILMYCSNWYHSPIAFRGNFYIDISDTWAKKEQAILAYGAEIERVGEKWLHFFKNSAENAGYRIGVKYAEVFEVVNWLAQWK
jgi:LmbE family N-acetylglucosaminyl deacetylase